MTLSMYHASVPQFIHMLGNLKHLLEKGLAHTKSHHINETILVNDRLFPDMYPLSKQVQIACDMAKGCGARLANVEAPKFEDSETTFTELVLRVEKTIIFLKTLSDSQINGTEEKPIQFNIKEHVFNFKGIDYVFNWAIPNVYFHITTTYNILRHNGVALGKSDFLGKIQ